MPAEAVAASALSNGVRVIIGANRGIGLALARAYCEDPGTSRLIVTHRSGRLSDALARLQEDHPGLLETVPLDVSDKESLAQFGAFMSTVEGGFDLAVHTIGMLHDGELKPERSLEECAAENLKKSFEINSIAPIMVAQALLADLPRRRRFTFAALSAMVGSIGDNRRGGWYGYRASKSALNQFLKTLSIECRRRFPHAAVVAMHPGTTDTDLSKPFQRSVTQGKLYTPEQTALRLLNVLSSIDERRNGQFINWDGKQIPW